MNGILFGIFCRLFVGGYYGLKDLKQSACGENLLNHLRNPLHLEMLLIQLTRLAVALLLDIPIDNLRNNLLSLLIELQMGGPFQNVIQKVIINHN